MGARVTPQQFRLRAGRHASAVSPYTVARDAAIAAAVANSASLWFLGNASELIGNVFTDSGGTIQASVGNTVGYLKDRNGNTFPATQSTAGAQPTIIALASGYYALALNGSQALNSGRAFAQSSDHTVIGVASNVDTASDRTLFATSTTSTAVQGDPGFIRFPQLRFKSGMLPDVQYAADGNPLYPEITGSTVSSSLPPPISTIKTGPNLVLWVNNINVGTVSVAVGTKTFNISQIGGIPNLGETMLGNIALICAGPVAMSNADRQAIEAFGAFLTGVTYP
jgi:hypothetical protein